MPFIWRIDHNFDLERNSQTIQFVDSLVPGLVELPPSLAGGTFGLWLDRNNSKEGSGYTIGGFVVVTKNTAK